MSNQSLAPTQYTDLRALFISCTLKRSPEPSHTETLMRVSQAIMETQGVTVETVRAVDYDLAPGVQPDMSEHGLHDDWPGVYEKVRAADLSSAHPSGWASAPRSVRVSSSVSMLSQVS